MTAPPDVTFWVVHLEDRRHAWLAHEVAIFRADECGGERAAQELAELLAEEHRPAVVEMRWRADDWDDTDPDAVDQWCEQRVYATELPVRWRIAAALDRLSRWLDRVMGWERR